MLVIAAELCSLTFQPEDKSKSNLIGTSLFADGIAAVLIGGEKASRKDPGGKKVIDAYLTSLSMDAGQLAASQKVLQKHGNMSSATILHVIKEQLLHGRQKENEKGLIGALGPGFSSELLLFSWERGAS